MIDLSGAVAPSQKRSVESQSTAALFLICLVNMIFFYDDSDTDDYLSVAHPGQAQATIILHEHICKTQIVFTWRVHPHNFLYMC